MLLGEKLKPHVPAVIAAHRAGDKAATQIITLYNMHVRCPADPGAPALCEAAFDEWMKSRNEVASA